MRVIRLAYVQPGKFRYRSRWEGLEKVQWWSVMLRLGLRVQPDYLRTRFGFGQVQQKGPVRIFAETIWG